MSAITVYSRDNCQSCRAVKRWLTERNIPFTAANADDLKEGEYPEDIRALPLVHVATEGRPIWFGGFNVVQLKLLEGGNADRLER